jgi:hypothetical protein
MTAAAVAAAAATAAAAVIKVMVGGGNRDNGAFCYTRNMGSYCSTHSHNPVGINHTSATCTQKRDNNNNSTTAKNRMGGCMLWPGVTRVQPSQQDHQSYKRKSAPNWQGQELDEVDITKDIRKAAIYKIKPALLANYYSILSDIAPSPCQVKEQEISEQPKSIHNVNETKALEQLIRKGVFNGSIPSIIADSAATSHVGTKHDPFIPMGRTSEKDLPTTWQHKNCSQHH